MSTVFGILASLILIVSIWVNWRNHEAYNVQTEQKEEYYKKYTNSKAKRDKKEKELNDLNLKWKGDLSKLKDELVKLDGVKAEIAQVKATIGEREQVKQANAEKIKEAEDTLADLPSPEELVPQIKRDKAELKETERQIQEESARLAELKAEISRTRDEIKGNDEWERRQRELKSQPVVKTTIKSIYKGWGFVVIGAGNTQGVVPNSILQVKRGEDVICELEVTNVTANSASADIITDSMMEGENIRLGDLVVPKPEEKKPLPGEKAAAQN